MRNIIFVILTFVLVVLYSIDTGAREWRITNNPRPAFATDTIWKTQQIKHVGDSTSEQVLQYLHTDIKIFHGPTAQSVIDFFRAWEDSVDVKIVGAVDLEINGQIIHKTKHTYWLTVTYRVWREE